MSRASLFAALLLAIPACGPSEPRVVVSVSAPANDLVRLRLLVRECGESRFALLEDIDTRGPAPTDPLDAAVAPGKVFYVWVQGWEACPIEPQDCPDEETAPPGTCICFNGEPLGQKLVSEACSRWFRAPEGQTELTLRLGPVEGDCPPRPLASCDRLE